MSKQNSKGSLMTRQQRRNSSLGHYDAYDIKGNTPFSLSLHNDLKTSSPITRQQRRNSSVTLMAKSVEEDIKNRLIEMLVNGLCLKNSQQNLVDNDLTTKEELDVANCWHKYKSSQDFYPEMVCFIDITRIDV